MESEFMMSLSTEVITQIVISVVGIFISVIATVVGAYLKNWLNTSKFAIEYNLNNEKNERTLANAVLYAESAIKRVATDSITKRELSINYLKKIDPALVEATGDKLEYMLDRKIGQITVGNLRPLNK